MRERVTGSSTNERASGGAVMEPLHPPSRRPLVRAVRRVASLVKVHNPFRVAISNTVLRAGRAAAVVFLVPAAIEVPPFGESSKLRRLRHRCNRCNRYPCSTASTALSSLNTGLNSAANAAILQGPPVPQLIVQGVL